MAVAPVASSLQLLIVYFIIMFVVLFVFQVVKFVIIIIIIIKEVSASAPRSEAMTSEFLPIIATKNNTQGPKTFQSICSSTKKHNESS